jgi:H+/Cl- antiporter ClcA
MVFLPIKLFEEFGDWPNKLVGISRLRRCFRVVIFYLMNVATLLTLIASLLLAKFILNRFMLYRAPDNRQRSYLDTYRYVGLAIVFCFPGLMLSVYLVTMHVADNIPRPITVLGPIIVGALVGAIVAYRFPNSLTK